MTTLAAQVNHLEWLMTEKGLIAQWNELKRIAASEDDGTNVDFSGGAYTYFGDIVYESGGFDTDVTPTIARTTPVGFTDVYRGVPNGGRPPTQAA